jgi:hypothetical protein
MAFGRVPCQDSSRWPSPAIHFSELTVEAYLGVHGAQETAHAGG